MTRRNLASALLVALVLTAAACSGSSGGSGAAATTSTAKAASAATASTALRALHAIRGTGAHVDPRIVDDHGSEVLLRGVNVNSLGDYFQANASYPTTVPVTETDWAAMQADGFDVVRLLISWSTLEPTKGHISQGYLATIHDTVAAAARTASTR